MAMNTKKLRTLFSKFEQIKADMEAIHDKAQTSYDNRSDKWKESDAASTEYERISNLESAISDLDSAMQNIDNAMYEDDA